MSVEQVKIQSLDEIPADHRRGGQIQVLLSPKTVNSTTGFLGIGTIQPGERISEHYHPYSEEFIYVMEGKLTAHLNDIVYQINAQEGFMIPIGMRHRLLNEDKEETSFVFHLCPLAPRPDMGHVDTE